MKVVNRELLKKYLSMSNSETVCENSIHTFFLTYGFEHDKDLEVTNELESTKRNEKEDNQTL